VERAAWKASQPEIDIHRLVMTFEQLVPTDKWLETRNRHSDKEKFHSDLNRPESYEMSERLLKTLRKSGDFQAEYKGAPLFIRSSVFSTLTRAPDCIPTNPDASSTSGSRLFAAGLVKVSLDNRTY